MRKYRISNVVLSSLKLIFVGLFFVSQNSVAWAINKRPISSKIWLDLDKKDKEELRMISILLSSQKYDEALGRAKSFKQEKSQEDEEYNPFFVDKTGFNEALRNLILWQKYSDDLTMEKSVDHVSFNDISRFIEDNSFYPNINKLRTRAQNIASQEKIPYRLTEQYFLSNPANDLSAKLYLVGAKMDFLLQFEGNDAQKNKIADEIQKAIVKLWIEENFSVDEEKNFLEKYQKYLTPINHQERATRLIWDYKFDDARRIFKFIDDDHQLLFDAAIEIRALPKYIKNILLSVPRKLRDDELLTYGRVLWYKSQDDADEVVDLLEDVKEMKYPKKWWSLRRLYARELLKTKDYKQSYRIISQNGLETDDKDYWEAQWTSGWIALRFLDKPEVAYQHFLNLYHNVKQPVTISRATYWLGMAALANGDKNKAIEWYKIASNYPLYFYGQLAIHKHRMLDPIGASSDIILPKDPDITVGDARKVAARTGPKVAYLLALMGEKRDATKIFEYEILNSESAGEIAVLMRIVNELDDREMDAKVSRTASQKNVFFIRDKFQIVKEVEDSDYAPLIHAIIKQESGFAPSARSVVGAIGFMQIMPDTAKQVASSLGIRYSKYKLERDVNYNVRLGSHYIKQMIDRFDGSELLAIASYNAGPHNAQRWIDEFYDPRDQKDIDKVIDWVELITYSETRNYVQRITENLIVYKYLMTRSEAYEVK